jgi:hypothetical protein
LIILSKVGNNLLPTILIDKWWAIVKANFLPRLIGKLTFTGFDRDQGTANYVSKFFILILGKGSLKLSREVTRNTGRSIPLFPVFRSAANGLLADHGLIRFDTDDVVVVINGNRA